MNIDQLIDYSMLGVYRKIIRKYELEIEDLKSIIKHLNKGQE